MIYTVGEMAQKLGVPASTLRYYDKEGLLPFVERSSGGIRMFRENDFEWLQVIRCMKKAGMERGTEYGLEQVYNVIDSRYRSGKPLIVTTNHTPDMLENPQDTAHARIYDRLIEMCSPVCFTAKNFRKEAAKAKLDRLKELLK